MSRSADARRDGRGSWRRLVGGLAIVLLGGLVILGPSRLFDVEGFRTGWDEGTADRSLSALFIASEIAAGVAQVALAIVVIRFARRWRGKTRPWLPMLLAALVVSSGLVHLLDVVLLWYPVHRADVLLKLVVAGLSSTVLFAFVTRVPRLAQVLDRRNGAGSAADTTRLEEMRRELEVARAAAREHAAQSETMQEFAERNLRALERMSSLLIESSPQGQILIDSKGCIVLFNRMAERIFGYERREVLGRAIEVLVPERFHADHVRQRSAYVGSPSAREMGAGRDLFGVRKDGTEVPVEIGLNPVETPAGPGVLASVIDITNRRRAESELRNYADALAATNLELEQFAQFASHDLQEPLRKLVSFSKLLAEDVPDGLPDDAKRDLEYIVDAAQRMRELVRGLLDLANSSRGEIVDARVDLGECARAALEALSERVAERSAVVRLEPLPVVTGDRRLLTQVFQNLIANAVKFQAPGAQPEVRVDATQAGGDVEVVVTDNGIGIPAEYREVVFRPFKRLHGRGHYEGAGIGLALCQKVVARHGGRIWVTSEPGKGAEFHFTIPGHRTRGETIR